MKICFLANSLNITDGGGRFSHDLVENLRRENIEVAVLTVRGRRLLFDFLSIRKIFKKSDIIHAIDIWPCGFYARLISLGLKKPIIITALGTYSVAPFFSWRWPLMKWTCNGAQLIAISDYTKEKIAAIVPYSNPKVIYPGFNLDFWSGDSIANEEILRLKPYILSVGAIKPRKGYQNSIRAFAIIAERFKNVNYVIVGYGSDSDYANVLKSLIREYNLKGRVFFVGSVIDDNKLLGFYRNAEIFVLTPVEENYHFEGFGIVYIEAAASGLPIVATRESGASSAVGENYNGLLVDQNNPQETADAITKILSDNELRMILKNNSREWIKKFSWEKIIKNYLDIYNEKIKHH